MQHDNITSGERKQMQLDAYNKLCALHFSKIGAKVVVKAPGYGYTLGEIIGNDVENFCSSVQFEETY